MENATTTIIALKELAGNPPPHLTALQLFLHDHLELFTDLWTLIWIGTVVSLVVIVYREYKKQRR